MENQEAKLKYLEDNIFVGLTNINDGFDVKSIKYFSESDFRIVLERIEKLGLGIYGIEPWKNGTFYDVYGYEDYDKDPTDPQWYNQALNDFVLKGDSLQYSATYYIPHLEKQL